MGDATTSDQLLAELARRHSAGLLDQAIEHARRNVRDELARRLETGMMAAVLSEQDTEKSRSDSRPTAGESGLYVYGFTRATDLDLGAVPGVATDEPVRVFARQGLGLIVSDIRLAELADLEAAEPTEQSRLAELVRRHDAVVRAVFAQDVVLPLRFGTVLPDAAAATALLDEHRDDALVLLDRIAGTREWGAKVLAVDEPTTAEEPKPSNGTEFLARKRDELEARRATGVQRRELADGAHTALAEIAADSRSDAPRVDGVLLDGAYLVAEPDTDEFLASVGELGDRLTAHGLTLRATGPWPPYSFAVLPERADV